jgi:predicted RNA methylase
MQRNTIRPTILGQLLNSASNAPAKGQAQYFTPTKLAQELAAGLPKFRPAVTDLTCGTGSLLAGVASKGTSLLGADIDPCTDSHRRISRISTDLTLLYPMLVEVEWSADLFALNPPWDLHWYRDRLTDLANSDLPAVVDAFKALDGRTARDTIDSTIATLMIALDRCTRRGEGFLIANESTVQRLILGDHAPHAALAAHIWGHLVIPGNPCIPGAQDSSPASPPALDFGPGTLDPSLQTTPVLQHSNTPPSGFQTAVLFFARDHTAGPTDLHPDRLADQRCYRDGAELSAVWQTDTEEQLLKWTAVQQRVDVLQSQKPEWNLWLDQDGHIQTALSLFEQHSIKVDKLEAVTLHSLQGTRPMQLVIQRRQRQTLQRAAFGGLWKVHPHLQSAVEDAVKAYNLQRAPLQPLKDIQRLAYLDEEDFIICKKDLFLASDLAPERDADGLPARRSSPASTVIALSVPTEREGERRPQLLFLSGQRYALATETVSVRRFETRPNLYGDDEAIEFNGQELAIYLDDARGCRRTFMDAKLRHESVHLFSLNAKRKPDEDKPVTFDFTLEQLVEHFLIPTVPDVSAANPTAYAAHLATLELIEHLVSGVSA